MIKAVVFDIDNTLTNDVSWLRVTELLGASVSRHEDIFHKFSLHELSYEDAKHQLIQLWRATGYANKAHWEALFADWSLKSDASAVVDFAMKEGYETALITGSVDLFAEGVARKLSTPHWYANTKLVWDEGGELVDFQYVRDQAAQKLLHLNEFLSSTYIEPSECIVIGDGDNAIDIFRATGRGIAVRPAHEALLSVSWQEVDHLSDVIPLLTEAGH